MVFGCDRNVVRLLFPIFLLAALSLPVDSQEQKKQTLEEIVELLQRNPTSRVLAGNFNISLPRPDRPLSKPISNGGKFVARSGKFVKLRGFSWMIARRNARKKLIRHWHRIPGVFCST